MSIRQENNSNIPSPDELRTSEIRYRRLFESARDGILILDAVTRKITDVNPFMTELLGCTREEFLGKQLWEIGLLKDEQANIAAFEELRNDRYIRYEDLPLKTKGGERCEVEFVGNVYSEADRQVIQCNIRKNIGRNRSKNSMSNRATEEILQLNETLEQRVVEQTFKLEAVNKELESFSYSVSHDLRAPLRRIEGFCCILLEDYAGKIDETGQKYLKNVSAASQNITQLIDDLSKYSSVTRGEIQFERFNLSDQAREIAEKLREREPERTVEFRIEDNIIAGGDKRLLGIALQNLFENAWKFTSKREGAEIAFGAVRHGEKTEYYVRDNGAGFEAKYADKIFGVFQRLHSADEFEGTGIGLAIVQRIVRRHGGFIRAESKVREGGGAAFYFTL